MNFTKDFPDQLRTSLVLSEVIGKKVRLKQRGKEFVGLCPFHNEKTPSFTVNNQKGLFHCFGCQESGDAIGFVMRSENLDYKTAVISLADRFGIVISYEKYNKPQAELKKEEESFEIADAIQQFFIQNLKQSQGKLARQYLENRGIGPAICQKFNLGFAPNSYEALTNHLLKLGFEASSIEKCGAIGKNDRGKFYDKFRNRIIFPINDSRGRIIAFGGRTIADDLPKYLNSSETDLFKKSQTLYNFAAAKQPIATKGFAIMAEGYMDVISLNIFGIENAVAGLGTAISKDHLQSLFRFTQKIVICLDGDEAGIRAAKRVANLALPLIGSKRNIYFVILPLDLDPDEFLKKYGSEAFLQKIDEAKSLSEFIFESITSSIKQGYKAEKNQKFSAEEKAKIASEFNEICEQISDQNSKKFFAQFFKDSLYFLGRSAGKNKIEKALTTQIIQKNLGKKSEFALSQNSKNLAFEQLDLGIVALLIFCPNLSDYHDEFFELRNCHFFSQKIESLKDFLIEKIDSFSEDLVQTTKNFESKNFEQILLDELKKSEFEIFLKPIKSRLKEINNAFCSIIAINDPTKTQNESKNNLAKYDWSKIKLRLFLLKDLLAQVDDQYQNCLKNSEIQTESSMISDSKITEIFKHKSQLQSLILGLEQEN